MYIYTDTNKCQQKTTQNKYKLPELQDFAIQFKIPKEIDNKKKTKLELIEDIKIYILNKNI